MKKLFESPLEEEREEQEEKCTKQGTLYIHKLGTDYQCKDCLHFLPDIQRCYLMGGQDVVKPYGTCGYWTEGPPNPFVLPPTEKLTKLEAGYEERAAGFSCKRCKHFSSTKLDCEVVDKNSPGDDAGMIHPNACCAAWEKGR